MALVLEVTKTETCDLFRDDKARYISGQEYMWGMSLSPSFDREPIVR